MDSLMNNFQNYKLAKGSGRELLISAVSIPDASCEYGFDGFASKIHTTTDVIRERSTRSISTSSKVGSTSKESACTYDLDAEYDTLVELSRKEAHTTIEQVSLDLNPPTNDSKLINNDLDDGSFLYRTRRGKLTFLPVKIEITRLSDEIVKKVLQPASAAKISSNPFYESMYKECEIKSKKAAEEELDSTKIAERELRSEDCGAGNCGARIAEREELVELFDLEESLGPDSTEPPSQIVLPSVPDLLGVRENLEDGQIDLDVLDMGMDLDYDEFNFN